MLENFRELSLQCRFLLCLFDRSLVPLQVTLPERAKQAIAPSSTEVLLCSDTSPKQYDSAQDDQRQGGADQGGSGRAGEGMTLPWDPPIGKVVPHYLYSASDHGQ